MVVLSYLVNYNTLLQIATGIITKCDSYHKMKQIYYKIRQFTKCYVYYKMRFTKRVLQNRILTSMTLF